MIASVKQIEDCLEITIQYGGGCEKVDLDLIGSGDYGESLPVITKLKTILKDNDSCEAWITETFSFDMEDIRYEPGAHIVQLDILGYDEIIIFSYD